MNGRTSGMPHTCMHHCGHEYNAGHAGSDRYDRAAPARTQALRDRPAGVQDEQEGANGSISWIMHACVSALLYCFRTASFLIHFSFYGDHDLWTERAADHVLDRIHRTFLYYALCTTTPTN